MSRTNPTSWTIKTAALLIAGVAATAALVFLISREVELPPAPDQAAQSAPGSGTHVPDTMSQQQGLDTQDALAFAALTARPISGAVTERPDFLSDMEWQMLRSVAQSQPNSSEKLTNLVNRLLFIKKRTAWESSGENTALRSGLARQLLAMLPKQAEIETLDVAGAQEMEARLLADLRGAQY